MIDGIVTLADSIVWDRVAVDIPEKVSQIPSRRDVNAAEWSGNRRSDGCVLRRVEYGLHALYLERREWTEVASGGRRE